MWGIPKPQTFHQTIEYEESPVNRNEGILADAKA